ncbi:MAG: hypothetical protein ACLRNQ_02230 [Flavonifractor plautii]
MKAYRKSWFMPLAAAGMDGITGFVYLSDRGWSPEGLIFFGTESLLCGASAYFYRIAFTPGRKSGRRRASPPADGEPAHSGGHPARSPCPRSPCWATCRWAAAPPRRR